MQSATDHMNSFDYDSEKDQSTRRKAMVAALLALLLWLIILIYPVFSYTFPLPEKPGILLSFGELDGGGEQAAAIKSSEESTATEAPESNLEKAAEIKDLSKQETTAKSVDLKIQAQTEEFSTIQTNDSKKKSEAQEKSKQDAENLKKIEAEKKLAEDAATQKQAAEDAAKKKKAAEQAKLEEFGSFFSGEGTGDETKKQGDPKGAPDKSKLQGLSTGKSNIGGGLAERGVLYEPDINDNSQKVGRVVIRVCVNGKGIVTESKFTQKGSTSTDITLIDIAEKAAAQYRFSPSGLEKQCGTISIDFKLK